ncbi:MAG: hypothetical protein RSG48_03660 [Clostridia bacterium]
MSKLEKVRDYIKKCPYLVGNKIAVSYLDKGIDSYSIDEIPSNPILKEYKAGDKLLQKTFDFTVKAPFSELENLKNSQFCEDFSDWIVEQQALKILPEIENIQKIKCITPGYVIQTNDTTAIYVIQMQIVWYKKI